jgi:hypothetical protein
MSSNDVAIVVAIIAGSLTVLGGAITVALSRRADRSAAAEEDRREHKVEVYNSFLTFWFWALMHQQLGVAPPTVEENQAWFVNFTRQCIPWASDGFIQAYAEMRRNFFPPAGTAPDVIEAKKNRTMHVFENVLFEIRRDLGHENKDLPTNTILALWINDLDPRYPNVPISVEAGNES